MTEPDEAMLWAREQAKQLREAPNDPTRDLSAEIDAGKHDDELSDTAHAYRAGARMAREQERERAKGLMEYVEGHARYVFLAREVLAKYRGEA